MADDFIGSIAQQDVDFVTEIVKTVSPGDNYKHLAVYTDNTQIASGASLVAVKDASGTVVGHAAEVTTDNMQLTVKGQLLTWLTDYFTAGAGESVYVYVTDATMTEELLTKLFNATHQLAYFKTVCIAGEAVDGRFQLDADAATWLATLCATDSLLSSVPFYPLNTALDDGEVVDEAYVACEAANLDAFWVFSQKLADGTVHHGGLVALGLALSVVNDSGTYVGNSLDMVATDAAVASGYQGMALDPTTQSVLKAANIAYFKPIGDTTGRVALRGASSSKGKVIPAYWIVSYCNYVNKVLVANHITRRNVFKNATTYNVLLSILANTVSRFVRTGRVENFALTAPTYADLPVSKGDEIIVPNAWVGTYRDDLRTVKIYGTLVI